MGSPSSAQTRPTEAEKPAEYLFGCNAFMQGQVTASEEQNRQLRRYFAVSSMRPSVRPF